MNAKKTYAYQTKYLLNHISKDNWKQKDWNVISLKYLRQCNNSDF